MVSNGSKHSEIYADYKSLIWVQKMFEKKLQGKTYRKSVKSEKLKFSQFSKFFRRLFQPFQRIWNLHTILRSSILILIFRRRKIVGHTEAPYWNFLNSLWGLKEPSTRRVAVPTRQATQAGRIDSLESIPGLLKSLKIRVLFAHRSLCLFQFLPERGELDRCHGGTYLSVGFTCLICQYAYILTSNKPSLISVGFYNYDYPPAAIVIN